MGNLTIDPNTLIKVTLTVEEWEAIFGPIAVFVRGTNYRFSKRYDTYSDFQFISSKAHQSAKQQLQNALEHTLKLRIMRNA